MWHGLLDAGMSTSFFNDQLAKPLPDDWNYHQQYDTLLFRGYIEHAELGSTILAALRLEKFNDQQLLVREGKLHCEVLPAPPG